MAALAPLTLARTIVPEASVTPDDAMIDTLVVLVSWMEEEMVELLEKVKVWLMPASSRLANFSLNRGLTSVVPAGSLIGTYWLRNERVVLGLKSCPTERSA